MTEEKKSKRKEKGEISRREFLKDAGLIVGGAAIGSTVLLAACGDGEVTTETVTQTQTQTQTVTTTQQVGEVTTTVTDTTTVDVSKFICPYDGQEFSTLSALQAHVAAAHPEAPAVVGKELTKLTVNGNTYELRIEPNRTLAEVLRDTILLTGTKVSCDRGICGACTVLVDGQACLSCTQLAVNADGSEITTIEGIGAPNNLHPLQEAFLVHGALQCGYCTPGMIMTAKGLLDENPNPTESDVREALAGNLCRCHTYQKITEAVLAAA